MIFGTTTLSHWDRNYVPNDNNFVPNHHWCVTQYVSHTLLPDKNLCRRGTLFLSQLRHSSWPADRFGTQLLAHSNRSIQFDFGDPDYIPKSCGGGDANLQASTSAYRV